MDARYIYTSQPTQQGVSNTTQWRHCGKTKKVMDTWGFSYYLYVDATSCGMMFANCTFTPQYKRIRYSQRNIVTYDTARHSTCPHWRQSTLESEEIEYYGNGERNCVISSLEVELCALTRRLKERSAILKSFMDFSWRTTPIGERECVPKL